jgi:hypothetical protein
MAAFLEFLRFRGPMAVEEARALRYRVRTPHGKQRLSEPGCWTDGRKSGKLAGWQFDDGMEGHGSA